MRKEKLGARYLGKRYLEKWLIEKKINWEGAKVARKEVALES